MKKALLKGATILFVSFFAVSFIITPANGAFAWTTEKVDSDGIVGIGAAIALDNLGNPWISYSQIVVIPGETDYYLKTSHFTGTTWITSIIDSTADSYTTIATDSSGNPAIVYEDLKDRYLQYAHFTGSDWSIQTVEKAVDTAWGMSLEFDATDKPHISYVDGTDMFNTIVKYATPDGAGWSIMPVGSGVPVEDTAPIALDNSGNPSICYYDSVAGALFYVQAPSWTPITVDSVVSSGGSFPSLKFNSADKPCVSYVNANNLIYAYLDSGTWHKTTVDSSGNINYCTSLALDYASYPHICYYNQYSGDLKYAHYDSLSWHTEVVDYRGISASYHSLVLDSTGNPYIGYFDGTNLDLKCAYSILMKAPSVTPESDGVGVLLFSAIAAAGCYFAVKRKTA
jgi:hypothetical protein